MFRWLGKIIFHIKRSFGMAHIEWLYGLTKESIKDRQDDN